MPRRVVGRFGGRPQACLVPFPFLYVIRESVWQDRGAMILTEAEAESLIQAKQRCPHQLLPGVTAATIELGRLV